MWEECLPHRPRFNLLLLEALLLLQDLINLSVSDFQVAPFLRLLLACSQEYPPERPERPEHPVRKRNELVAAAAQARNHDTYEADIVYRPTDRLLVSDAEHTTGYLRICLDRWGSRSYSSFTLHSEYRTCRSLLNEHHSFASASLTTRPRKPI